MSQAITRRTRKCTYFLLLHWPGTLGGALQSSLVPYGMLREGQYLHHRLKPSKSANVGRISEIAGLYLERWGPLCAPGEPEHSCPCPPGRIDGELCRYRFQLRQLPINYRRSPRYNLRLTSLMDIRTMIEQQVNYLQMPHSASRSKSRAANAT